MLFIREFCDNIGCFALKSKKCGGYVGFDKRGEAIDLKKVDPKKPEGKFQMHPTSS